MRKLLLKTGLVIIIVLLSSLTIYPGQAINTTIASQSNVIYVGGSGPNNYSSIQAAIENASTDDTVFVYKGTYFEHHILVDKKVNIIGENKNSTIIDALGNFIGVQIQHNEVVFEGFTIRNNSYKFDWWLNSLVEVKDSKKVVIKNNIFINDYDKPNDENRVCGICILDSTDCILQNNSFQGCNILIYYLDTFDLDRTDVKYFFHSIDTSNKVNGKTVYYYKNQDNVVVPEDAGQVIFANTNHSTISGIENDNTSFNIQLFYSNDNTIIDNKINDSLSGFWLHNSNYNVFKDNKVNRTSCSLFLWQSSYNYFENNILPAATIEQYSDRNKFIKNHFRASRTYNFSIQLECSDYNIFECNNIFGCNFIYAHFTNKVKAVALFKSYRITWDKNYWGNYLREKYKFLAIHSPKIIVGFCRGFYGPLPGINFPSYINIDWHPADRPYMI